METRGRTGIGALIGAVALLALGAVFLFSTSDIRIEPPREPGLGTRIGAVGEPADTSTAATGTAGFPAVPVHANTDIPPQPKLPDAPAVARGIYITGWSAGSPRTMERIYALLERRSDLNAVVIDIKDFSGNLSYRTGIEEAVRSGAEGEPRIAKPNALLKELHERRIYVIARQTVFQDPIFAAAHPEWAVRSSSTGGAWKDRKGLSWMDPAAEAVWDYNISVARDALQRGFDEVQFDYVRFPSDGNLDDVVYPVWTGTGLTRAHTIRKFFTAVRAALPDARLSADLFGLTTIAADDMGIGQLIEDGYRYFDFVSPMVYPSHFAFGFEGFANPAAHPYEVVAKAMRGALAKLQSATDDDDPDSDSASSSIAVGHGDRPLARLRPWLQVFDLGAVYTRDMIDAQIRATEEVLHGASTTADVFGGWLLWDPANAYSRL